MNSIAISFFLIALSIFTIISSILVYHFMRFRISSEHHKILLSVFMIVSLILVVFEFYLFFSIDWQGLLDLASKEVSIQENNLNLPF